MTANIFRLTLEREMDFMLAWATQTIAFCLSLKPEGDDAKYEAQRLPETSRASAIAIELWRDALGQCGGNITDGAGAIFLLNVFRWCERRFAAA
jgi:hypothetical protein